MKYTKHDKVFPKLRRDVAIAGAGIVLGAVAVTTTAAVAATSQGSHATYQYIKQPSWLYIDPASSTQRQETCGYWPHTHYLIPGVLVTSGDTAVMFCKNGKAYPS